MHLQGLLLENCTGQEVLTSLFYTPLNLKSLLLAEARKHVVEFTSIRIKGRVYEIAHFKYDDMLAFTNRLHTGSSQAAIILQLLPAATPVRPPV